MLIIEHLWYKYRNKSYKYGYKNCTKSKIPKRGSGEKLQAFFLNSYKECPRNFIYIIHYIFTAWNWSLAYIGKPTADWTTPYNLLNTLSYSL